MFTEYLPTADCSSFLENIWFSDNSSDSRIILPDNYSDIIIPLDSSDPVKYVGHMTSYLVHNPKSNEKLLGLRLKPGYSVAFIREEMSKLTDKVVELSAIQKHTFDKIKTEYIKYGKFPFEAISSNLFTCFDGFKQDPYISESIKLIKKTSGNIKIEILAEAVGISRRMLEKKFIKNLGKTPKRFAQIERLNAFIKNKDSLYVMNYYDQSHMIKEFKMLTGMLPSEILS